LFVESKSIDIKKEEIDSSGSLFHPNNPNGHLFGTKIPLAVGDFITVKTVPVGASTPKDAKSTENDPKLASDPLTQELLSALPNLGGEEVGASVLPEIQMEITSISPLGDLGVRASRTSQVDDKTKYLSVAATIPGRVVHASQGITTKDLRKVQFHEDGPESIRRANDSWLDEYSLRYSGFSETASKNARQLAEDKRRLGEVRTRLDNRIQAFSSERKKMTEERAKIFQDATSKETKIVEANKTIMDREQEIESLKSQLGEEQKKRESMEAKLAEDSADKAKEEPVKAPEKESKPAPKKADKNVAKK